MIPVFNARHQTCFILCGKSPYGAAGGGYSAFAYNLAKILKKLGYKVYIVALGDKNETIQTTIGTLLLFKSPFINFNTTALPGLPIYSYLFANGIEKIVREQGSNEFIVWGIGPWGLAGAILKGRLGKRVIHINNYFTTVRHEWKGALTALSIQDYGIWLKLKYTLIYYTVVRFLSYFERKILKSADLIVTNYQSTEEIIKKEFNIPKSKFYRTGFTVEIYRRKDAQSSSAVKLPGEFIFFVSRHELRKGVNFLLHAYKILLERGVKTPLLIAGTGQMLQANIKLAKKLGISGQVKFLGFVNDSKPIMKKSTVFVFPSVEEGAGALTINEAMSLGLAIISTACDGIVEDIENKKSGLLVPMANPKALADSIEYLLKNPRLRKELGRNTKARFRKEFSLTQMEKDLKKMLSVFLKSR